MGYSTYYSGSIYLYDEKVIKLLRKMVKEETEPFDRVFNGDIYINNTNKEEIYLDISCEWKDYDDDMLKLCLFVAMLDKNSKGEIICDGEERDDNWKIIVEKGQVYEAKGEIYYTRDSNNFEDTSTKKRVYEITKDKNLMKELITENLE